MKYVFYDFETSGLSAEFDSIIQAAAILTDQDFNVIDSFDMRGRMKKEYPVPHPKALLVNGTGVELLKNHEDSNFSLIKKMQQKFLAWGETTYIGYNSLGFDERFLRQSLYQCALPPYLTNTNGNKRGDALKLIHSAAAVSPNSFVRPLNDDTGKITFKLEKFAPANGIVHDNAHDALGDVEATIGVCKIIKERCPDVWEAAMQTTSKQDVYKFINDDRIFCASRYFRGKEYTNGLAYLATDPTYQNHVYCFDLKTDPDLIFDLDRTELKKLFKGKNKCFQLIKANEQPILLDEKYLMQSEEFKDIDLNIFNLEIKEGKEISIKPKKIDQITKRLWGMNRSLINNAVIGSSKGYEKTLELVGVGYRAALKGNQLNLQLGYSHDINFDIPEGIKIAVEKQTTLKISGSDKQLVGVVVSKIKTFRKIEPYKGKGIREKGQYVLKKEGKKK